MNSIDYRIEKETKSQGVTYYPQVKSSDPKFEIVGKWIYLIYSFDHKVLSIIDRGRNEAVCCKTEDEAKRVISEFRNQIGDSFDDTVYEYIEL